MGLKHKTHLLANSVVSAVGKSMRLPKLPMLLSGKVVWLSHEVWPGVYSNYEPYLAKTLQKFLFPGAVFFDVGAHVGLWSKYSASIVGKSGKAVAFEPSDAFEILKKNCTNTKRFRLERMGVGESDGEAVFHGQGAATSGSFVRSVTEINRGWMPDVPIHALTTPIRTLDSITKTLGYDPDVLKVDVEGFELKVLKGAEQLIARRRPTWIIEVHPWQLKQSGEESDEVLRFLEARNYEISVLHTDPNKIFTILATPRS